MLTSTSTPTWAAWGLGILLSMGSVGFASPADSYGLGVPRGSRAAAVDQFSSGKSFRDSVDFYIRGLASRGVRHRRVGPYRYRGVDVARFLIDDPEFPVAALHVYRRAGKTLIFFVKRVKS